MQPGQIYKVSIIIKSPKDGTGRAKISEILRWALKIIRTPEVFGRKCGLAAGGNGHSEALIKFSDPGCRRKIAGIIGQVKALEEKA